MCDPKKYPSPVQGGWGVSKAKMFKGKYETKLEFPEGCRVGGGGFVKLRKALSGRGMDIFLHSTFEVVKSIGTS